MLVFLKAQWRWALLGPLLMVLGSVLHEGAHALMTLALGGTVDEVTGLPTFGEAGLRFGLTTWSDLDDARAPLVAIAPPLAAHVHALAGVLLIPHLKPPLAKVLFFTSVGALAWRAFRSHWRGLESDQFALLLVALLASPCSLDPRSLLPNTCRLE